MWLAAGTGVAFALTGIAERRVIGLVIYIGLGWAMALMLPELARRLSGPDIGLLLIGGLLYTAGCIFMGLRWPDPYPTVFGYHEVWHVMVVVAAICHYRGLLDRGQDRGLEVRNCLATRTKGCPTRGNKSFEIA